MKPLSPQTRRSLVWLGGLAVLAFLGALATFLHTRLDRELALMPTLERRTLYERTLETLRTACARAPGPTLTDYCREQADFIRRFPECDSECHELAARFTPQPTR